MLIRFFGLDLLDDYTENTIVSELFHIYIYFKNFFLDLLLPTNPLGN